MLKIKNDEFNELVAYIKGNYGIDLSRKKNLIEGRLVNMLRERGISSFAEYIRLVFQDSTNQEVTTIINRLTTNHTFFMRETEHFEYFSRTVLPYLQATNKQRDLRIWSAGCSSGEEPYTLAMIMSDYFAEEKLLWDTKILATDISVKVLEKAEHGMYHRETLQVLPKYWQDRYFKKAGSEYYKIAESIKQEVIFRIFNLMDEEFPFKKKFHAIFCRNVMIYFDQATKDKLVRKFYDITENGGYLFIGHSESINREDSRYQYIMPAVYRKG